MCIIKCSQTCWVCAFTSRVVGSVCVVCAFVYMSLDLQKPSLSAQKMKSNLLLIIKPTLALPKNTKHIAIDDQICFHWRLIAKPVKPPWYNTGSVGPVSARMWLVPNCCQQLSRPVLWIKSLSVTYWRLSTAVCVLMEGLTHLWLPTHPYNVPFMILQSLWKKLLKTQQC